MTMEETKPRNKMREIRMEKRMKQTALAGKVSVHQSEISVIETGERIPSVYLAEKIAKALERSTEEVFPDLSH